MTRMGREMLDMVYMYINIALIHADRQNTVVGKSEAFQTKINFVERDTTLFQMNQQHITAFNIHY
jgi:hypothetical protein